MNSPKGVKSGVPQRVSISCHTCYTRHDLPQITRNQSFVTVNEQTIQHMWHRGVKFVNNVCMTTIEFPKSSLKFPQFANRELPSYELLLVVRSRVVKLLQIQIPRYI